MTDTLRFPLRRLALAVMVAVASGCQGLLDVSDPTLIRDNDIANASGANAQRLNASTWFSRNIVQTINDVAYFTDEWTWDVSADMADVTWHPELRNSERLEKQGGHHLTPLAHSFWQTSVAIPAVRPYTPEALRGDFLAQLYAIRGYLILQMAEDFCPGFPLNDVVDNRTVYSGPLTTDSAIALASSALDSAVAYAKDSARFVTFARVVKGRALLNQGKYAEAAAMVANVPTDAVYNTEVNNFARMNPFYCDFCGENTALGDQEGANGLPFVSANDPRVPLEVLGTRHGTVGVRFTDPTDTLYITTKGFADDARVTLAGGVEARLIEAEAALNANDPSWKSILDVLRATVGLDPLTDPGTTDGRVDLLYSERAFWLFMTGRRLGDMRRLVRNYGRAPETVFPSGLWRGGTGDQYGTATSFPFSFENQSRFNPHITSGCTSR